MKYFEVDFEQKKKLNKAKENKLYRFYYCNTKS